MDALCKCMFIIIETIFNTENEDKTCFKGHRCFSKNLFMSIRLTKNRFSLHLFLCTEKFTYRKRFTFTVYFFRQLPSQKQLPSSENVKCTFIIRFVLLSVPTYCILMQRSSLIKLFLLVYLTVSVVR